MMAVGSVRNEANEFLTDSVTCQPVLTVIFPAVQCFPVQEAVDCGDMELFVSQARVCALFVRVGFGDVFPHRFPRFVLSTVTLLGIDFFTTRWQVPSAVGKVSLWGDPVVIERSFVIF